MTVFLSRVKAFPSCRFVIINTEKLQSQNLETLLAFLSDREIASLGICFHCIQRGHTLIHTAPWIEGKSWDRDSLRAASASLTGRGWKAIVLKDISISVVSSLACGSSKTRFIRNRIKKFKAQGGDRQDASLVVHEKSSIGSLIAALKLKFVGISCRRALHVSFAFRTNRERQNENWLREINHFFSVCWSYVLYTIPFRRRLFLWMSRNGSCFLKCQKARSAKWPRIGLRGISP